MFRMLTMETGKPMRDIFRHMRQQFVCFINGDDALVDRENDPDVQNRSFLGWKPLEVLLAELEQLLGGPGVESEVSHCSIAELFRPVQAAFLAVGVWPEMEHGCPSDLVTAGQPLVEGCSAIMVPRQRMDAARWTEDFFRAELAALNSDLLDFRLDDDVDSVIEAGQNDMALSLRV